MILEKGNMWDVFGKTDLFLITTNPIVRKDGAAVMGRGIAKQAATRFPALPYLYGYQLSQTPEGKCWPIGKFGDQLVGCFMVKSHWREQASPGIIRESCETLSYFLSRYPELTRVDLNFPGIGNGKLSREDVLPIIEALPDSVHVWEYSEK